MITISAIVYTSNTGHTKEYAKMLGEETNIPVYSLDEAIKTLSGGIGILYLGWLMAGQVQGLKRAQKRFSVAAVCAVGMTSDMSQLPDIRKTNALPDALPVFYLPGGFEMEKLHGIYKLMMGIMKKAVGRQLAQKENKTPEDEEMLALLHHDRNDVDSEKLCDVRAWLNQTVNHDS